MTRAALVFAVLLGAFVQPVAAQTGSQAPSQPRASVESSGNLADLVSVARIRDELQRRGSGPQRIAGTPTDGRHTPTSPSVPAKPVYRVEIVGYRTTSMKDSLVAAVADAWPPSHAGYLDWKVPGTVNYAGAPVLIGATVSFDIVRSWRKWAFKHAVAKAKREVAEEMAKLGIK